MALTHKLLSFLSLMAVCTPSPGFAQDSKPPKSVLTVYVFSQLRFVDEDGTAYRSIGNERGEVVLAPAASKGTDQDINLLPDCKATHPTLGSGTFGSTATDFVIRFGNGTDLVFPKVRAPWPSLDHCVMDSGKP